MIRLGIHMLALILVVELLEILFGSRSFLTLITLLAGLVFVGLCAYRTALRWVDLQEREKSERDELMQRYKHDLHRTFALLSDYDLQSYAAAHYGPIIKQYRSSSDAYWRRSISDLDPVYVSFLRRQQHGGAVIAWYTEPERLFTAAQRVRAHKSHADEQAEWQLQHEYEPARRLDEFLASLPPEQQERLEELEVSDDDVPVFSNVLELPSHQKEARS